MSKTLGLRIRLLCHHGRHKWPRAVPWYDSTQGVYCKRGGKGMERPVA